MKLDTLRVLTEFYAEQYDKLVKRVSYRAGGPANAEDVVQEAFTRALTYIDSFEPDRDALGAWFNTILNNALKDFKKQERRQGATTDEPIIEDFDKYMYQQEQLEVIFQEIDDMPEPSRSIIRNFVVLGYSAKEVARMVDANIIAIRNTVQLFREYIRRQYA